MAKLTKAQIEALTNVIRHKVDTYGEVHEASVSKKATADPLMRAAVKAFKDYQKAFVAAQKAYQTFTDAIEATEESLGNKYTTCGFNVDFNAPTDVDSYRDDKFEAPTARACFNGPYHSQIEDEVIIRTVNGIEDTDKLVNEIVTKYKV